MKKYLYIFKFQLMTKLQYASQIVLKFVHFAIMIFIFLNLWNYMYSDSSEIINGYNKGQMIWYVIVTEFLWMTLSGRKLMRTTSDDVKSGNIAVNINKPYSYIGYVISTNMGDILISQIIFIILSLGLGYLFVGWIPVLNIFEILTVILTLVFSTIVSILLILCLGLLSFWIEDSAPLYWVYSKIILVFGTIFPIEFFPSFIEQILKYSPVNAISYGPAKLFTSYSKELALSTILLQICYIIVSYILLKIIYRRGVKKLSVNGG